MSAMSKLSEARQITILEKHVADIASLQHGNYGRAESLLQRTRMLATQLFPGSALYIMELAQLSFRQYDNTGIPELNRWNDAHNRLQAIAQAMLDEVQLYIPPEQEGHYVHKRIVMAAIVLLVLSIVLWSFNNWVQWQWLSAHPKRIAIYLSFQFALVFAFALSVTNSTKVMAIELIGIAVAIVYGTLSFVN